MATLAETFSHTLLTLSGARTLEFTISYNSQLTAGNLPGGLSVFSSEFLWWVVLALVFWALLQQSKIGNHIYAVGGNKQAATATGVRVDRTKLLAFGLAGATAAFAGMSFWMRMMSIRANCSGRWAIFAGSIRC